MKALLIVLLLATPVYAQTDIVASERARYGERITPAEVPSLLNAIARRLPNGPWGLLVKMEGNNCGGFACDIVCSATEHYDVLIDGPDASEGYAGTSRPAWQPKGPYAPRVCAFVAPASPEPPPQSTPQPCPSCPACPACSPADLGPILQRLNALEVSQELLLDEVGKMQASVNQAATDIKEHREETKKAYSMLKDWKFYVSTAVAGAAGWIAQQKAGK